MQLCFVDKIRTHQLCESVETRRRFCAVTQVVILKLSNKVHYWYQLKKGGGIGVFVVEQSRFLRTMRTFARRLAGTRADMSR
jgi:hypothetical protein